MVAVIVFLSCPIFAGPFVNRVTMRVQERLIRKSCLAVKDEGVIPLWKEMTGVLGEEYEFPGTHTSYVQDDLDGIPAS